MSEQKKRQTTLDFRHQLKGAILDAVDEGLIPRDPTRKVIIKGKALDQKFQYMDCGIPMHHYSCLQEFLLLALPEDWDMRA